MDENTFYFSIYELMVVGHFNIWAIMNSAIVNIHVQIFCVGRGFISLAYIPSVRIGGSHGNTIVLLWRNYQTISKKFNTIYIPTNSV